MDIKSKSHILKKRANELGYDIKLTHAQEMVAALFGHESRRSALLADKAQETLPLTPTTREHMITQNDPVVIAPENIEDTLFLDPFEPMAERAKFARKAMNIGNKIGHKYGKRLVAELDKHVDHYKSNSPTEDKLGLFYQSTLSGIVLALTSKLELHPMQEYFTELRQTFHLKPKHLPSQNIGEALNERHQEFWGKPFIIPKPPVKKKTKKGKSE